MSKIERRPERNRRLRAVRARTMSVTRTAFKSAAMVRREIEFGRMLYPDVGEVRRPTTRADCLEGERPCPFVSCRHHLYLDVSPATGSVKLNFPDLEPDEMQHSCSLDVADSGGATLEEVGAIMNLTRERARQIEHKSLVQIRLSAVKAWR
jgi:Sigma-70, region 4